MNETRHHWLVDAINKSHPGTLPPDSLLDSTSSIIAWHTLHRKFGLSYQYIAEAVADTYGLSVVDIRFIKKTEDNPFSERLCRKLGVFPRAGAYFVKSSNKHDIRSQNTQPVSK